MLFFLSSRATTKLSPPLLPLPATTKTPFLAALQSARESPWQFPRLPAPSSVRLGTPYFWIVNRSISRICAAVTTNIVRQPFKSVFNRSAPFITVKLRTASTGSNGLNDLNDLNGLFSRFSEQFLHLPHRLFDADDHGAGDDTVADVELDDFRDRAMGKTLS